MTGKLVNLRLADGSAFGILVLTRGTGQREKVRVEIVVIGESEGEGETEERQRRERERACVERVDTYLNFPTNQRSLRHASAQFRFLLQCTKITLAK